MQPKQNVFETLQRAIDAIREAESNPAAAPIYVDLARIETSLIVARDVLTRCNIDTVQS